MEINDAVRELIELIDDRNANNYEIEDRPRFVIDQIKVTGIASGKITVAAYDAANKRYRYGMFSDGSGFVCDGF